MAIVQVWDICRYQRVGQRVCVSDGVWELRLSDTVVCDSWERESEKDSVHTIPRSSAPDRDSFRYSSTWMYINNNNNNDKKRKLVYLPKTSNVTNESCGMVVL
jgi:hypothetical protein